MLLYVSAEKASESRSGLILELQAALNELVEEGKGYLGSLAGKQTVLSVFKVSFAEALWVELNYACALTTDEKKKTSSLFYYLCLLIFLYILINIKIALHKVGNIYQELSVQPGGV